MIYDTDVLIFFLRGSHAAATQLENDPDKKISIQTYMELMQCPKNKQEQHMIKHFITDSKIEVLPLTEHISHRAAIYVEQFALSHGVQSADALIAATAAELNYPLCSANKKHFSPLPDLELVVFEPH